MTRSTVLLAAGVLAAFGAPASAQEPAADSGFTASQAASGKIAYDQECADCHHVSLRGTAHGPELAGVGFLSAWGSRTSTELFEYVRQDMPPGGGGSLSDGDYLGIVAQILN